MEELDDLFGKIGTGMKYEVTLFDRETLLFYSILDIFCKLMISHEGDEITEEISQNEHRSTSFLLTCLRLLL